MEKVVFFSCFLFLLRNFQVFLGELAQWRPRQSMCTYKHICICLFFLLCLALFFDRPSDCPCCGLVSVSCLFPPSIGGAVPMLVSAYVLWRRRPSRTSPWERKRGAAGWAGVGGGTGICIYSLHSHASMSGIETLSTLVCC